MVSFGVRIIPCIAWEDIPVSVFICGRSFPQLHWFPFLRPTSQFLSPCFSLPPSPAFLFSVILVVLYYEHTGRFLRSLFYHLSFFVSQYNFLLDIFHERRSNKLLLGQTWVFLQPSGFSKIDILEGVLFMNSCLFVLSTLVRHFFGNS